MKKLGLSTDLNSSTKAIILPVYRPTSLSLHNLFYYSRCYCKAGATKWPLLLAALYKLVNIIQSINMYITSLQDPYSEALPTQVTLKRTVLRRTWWWNWEHSPLARCLRSIGSPFHVVGPTTENERVCIVAERANGISKLPWTEDHIVRRPAQEEREGSIHCIWWHDYGNIFLFFNR